MAMTPEHAAALHCVRALVAGLSQSARAVERVTGLSNAQLFVLHLVALEEGLSIRELAARALVRENTLSAAIARLVEQGLLSRDRADDDARRTEIRTTAAGRRVLKRAPVSVAERLLDAVGRLPKESAGALRDRVRELLALLGIDPDAEGHRLLYDAPTSRGAKRGLGQKRTNGRM